MGYIYKKDEIIKVLDEKTIIIMDTCVWLDLYTYSPTTIKSIVTSFESKSELFWLPYQVYIEFNRHMTKCRNEAVDRYKNLKEKVCNELSNVLNSISNEFNKIKNKGITDTEDLHSDVIADIRIINSKVKQELDNLNQGYSTEVKCIKKEYDIVSNFIESLHEQSKTNGFKVLELSSIYEEGEIRYKYKIPPGYTDEKKKEKYENEEQFLSRKYGDLILWKEILRKISDNKINVIFIENERKSDWWDKQSSNNTKIPKALIEEFQNVTLEDSKLYFIDFEEFLFSFGEILNLPANSIKEITSRLNFEKSIYEHIEKNKNSILEYNFNEYFEIFDYDNPLVKELIDMSFFGGSPEPVEYLEINKIAVKSSFLNNNNGSDQISIEAEIEVEFIADVIEYINRHVSHSGSVSITANVDTILNLSIDFSDNSIDCENAYNTESIDIYNIEFKTIDSGDFTIDVDFDEDMYRER